MTFEATTLKPSQIATALDVHYAARQPAFIWGPPGVGKSAVVKQSAKRLGIQLIDLRMVQLDPVDLRGLPYKNEAGQSDWAKPAFLPTSGAGWLFLDEFAQAVPGVMNTSSELVLDRTLGDYRLPDDWAVVMASNNATDRAATHKLPKHIASRVSHYEYKIDADDFTMHALQNDFRLEVIAFLKYRPELLHQFNPASTEKAFACPRTWEFVSNLLKQAPPKEIELAMYEGNVGQGAAGEFIAFVEVMRTLPSIDGILMSPGTADVPTTPATMYAVANALGRRASDANFSAVTAYANRLPAEFGLLTVKTAKERCPEIQQTRAFIEWSAQNVGVLI